MDKEYIQDVQKMRYTHRLDNNDADGGGKPRGYLAEMKQ